MECDGIVYGSSDIYEKDAIEANNRAYKFKTAVQVGPLSFPAVDLPEDSSPSGKEVVAFLQKALEEKGEKSVVYVRHNNIFPSILPLNPIEDFHGQRILDCRAREILGTARRVNRERDILRP